MLHACSICKKQFVFKKQLDEHLKEDHISIAKKFERAGTLLDEWMAFPTEPPPYVPQDTDDSEVHTMLRNLDAHINRHWQNAELRRTTFDFTEYNTYVTSLPHTA